MARTEDQVAPALAGGKSGPTRLAGRLFLAAAAGIAILGAVMWWRYRAVVEIERTVGQALQQQRWSEALPLLEKLLRRQPADPLALRQITTCRFQLGQYAPALQSAAILANIPDHEVEGIFLSAAIHRAQGNTPGAIDHWARLESLRPGGEELPISPAEFFLVYGEDLLAEGAPRTAVSKLEKSRESNESLPVLLKLGAAQSIAGDEAQAATAWTRALELDASNPEARRGLAELALERSDPEAALRWLTPIAASAPDSSLTAYLMERAHTMLGNEDELEHWQRRTAELRATEKIREALKRGSGRG